MGDKSNCHGQSLNKRRSGSVLVEWSVAFCACVIALLPVVDLVNFLIGASIGNLIAFQAAAAACPCSTIASSLAAMKNQSNSVAHLLGILCKMKPVKGYQGCGVDLYVIVTNYSSGAVQVYGPNCGVPPPIDVSTYVYEYQAVSCYEIDPLLNLSFTPLFRDVAIVGKPTTLTFSCNRMVESPDGLAGPGVLAMFGGNGVDPGGSNGSSGANSGSGIAVNPPDWNYPHLSFNTTIPSPDPNNPGFYVMNIYTAPPDSASGPSSVTFNTWIQGHFVSTSSDATIPTQDQFQAFNNATSSINPDAVNPGENIAPTLCLAYVTSGPGALSSTYNSFLTLYKTAESNRMRPTWGTTQAAQEASLAAYLQFLTWCNFNNY